MSPTKEELDLIYRIAGLPGEAALVARLALRLSAEAADYRLVRAERDEIRRRLEEIVAGWAK